MICRPTGRLSSGGQARRHRHPAVAGQVQRQRAQVEQVHRQRVVDLLPQRERGRRRRGRYQHVHGLIRRVEVARDQRAHLLRLVVVGVVVAGRQRIGANHDAPLDFRPETGRPGQRHHLLGAVRAVVADPQPVAHRVEAGQVARHLRRQNQVVGGQRVIEMGTVDFGHVGADRGQLLDGFVERRQHAGLITLAAQLPDHADAHTAQIACRPGLRGADDVGHLGVDGGGVARVVSGDHLMQQRGVDDGARAGPALVQRRRAGHQAVARDRAVGGLDPDGGGQRGRLANRAAGVGTDGQRRLERRQRGGTAAARTARHPVGVPRVAGRAVGGVLRRRTHRELVHVGLAEDRDAGRAQPRGHGGVVGRTPALEDLRAAGGGHVDAGEHVFEGQRDPGQRRDRLLPGGQ